MLDSKTDAIDYDFGLIETLAYLPSLGYRFLDKHLQRLIKSSLYFEFVCCRESILQALDDLKQKFTPESCYRVRILLNKNGKFNIETLEMPTAMLKIELPIIDFSKKTTNSNNILFQHKTTSPSVRKFYDDEYNYAKQGHNIFDIIFTNEKNQVTESSRMNIFIEKGGILFTPPIACGLLGGIMRDIVLHDKTKKSYEKILYPADIINAEKIFLTNSLRGIVEVKLLRENYVSA